MLQIIPIALLAVVLLLDLVDALVDVLSGFEALPKLEEIDKHSLHGVEPARHTDLCDCSRSSLALGFMVTLLSDLSSAVFATWTASWFLN